MRRAHEGSSAGSRTSAYLREYASVLGPDAPYSPSDRLGTQPGTAPRDPARVDPPFSTSTPTAYRPDPLPGYAWLQLPDRVREVHRGYLEFWYDPPGCALTDEELDLLRRIAGAEGPVMFQAEGRTITAHVAFDHTVDVLRDLRKAGWIVLEVWIAESGNCGHARRRYSAAQAYCTESGREGCVATRIAELVSSATCL